MCTLESKHARTTSTARVPLLVMIVLLFTTPGTAQAQRPDTILEWNRILLTTLATPGATEPAVLSRAHARRDFRCAQLV